MGLAGDWEEAEGGLPSDWAHAGILLTLEEAGQTDRAVSLLAPLQPLRAAPDAISIRIARRGGGPSPEAVRRGLGRLDAERLHGTLSILSVESKAAPAGPAPQPSLAESWDAALATVPADWSDLLGEIELGSSDWLDSGAVCLAPLNPRRVESSMRLQFRSASHFGYGASAGMVRRCLERCDAAGMHGAVRVLRVLSDSQPVGTQGPVWHVDGRMV